jgi:hypothetical protein
MILTSRLLGKVALGMLLFVGVAFWLLSTATPNNQILSSYEGTGHRVNWSRFAYAQYATNIEYLCNSVMIFDTLHRLQSKADRLLMYPSSYSVNETYLLRKARDQYNVNLAPIEVQRRVTGDCTRPSFPLAS